MKGAKLDRSWLVLILVVGLALGAVLLLREREAPPPLPLEKIRAQVIPSEGQATSYGIPLSLGNAQRFADWYYEIRLSPTEERTLAEALGAIPTPCCDDTRLTRCCCEEGGLICNLVRSARGLGAWLVREKGFSGEKLREAVEEWLRFVHPDYYVARALKEMGQDPEIYGFPKKGACYRGWCEVPLSRGGCGGMGLTVKVL
jgi:hypothetical protein